MKGAPLGLAPALLAMANVRLSCKGFLGATNTLAYSTDAEYTTLHFLFNPMTWPNKLECLIELGWNGLPGTNTLAYWG